MRLEGSTWIALGYDVVTTTGDCDDADASVSPVATERCDGIDNDCDGDTSESEASDRSTFYADADGDSFTGSNSGQMGSMEVENGKVEGNTLTWQMNMTVPMPMTLDCKATIDGDTLTGTVTAGMFGTFPMEGVRG